MIDKEKSEIMICAGCLNDIAEISKEIKISKMIKKIEEKLTKLIPYDVKAS